MMYERRGVRQKGEREGGGKEGTMDLTAGHCRPVYRISQLPHNQQKVLRTHWFLNSRKCLNRSKASRGKGWEGGRVEKRQIRSKMRTWTKSIRNHQCQCQCQCVYYLRRNTV